MQQGHEVLASDLDQAQVPVRVTAATSNAKIPYL